MMEIKSMRSISSALLIATAMTLTACGPVNRGLESANQPVVDRTDYVFDLDSATISPSDGSRLVAWFDALGLRYGDRVSIDNRAGYGNAQEVIGQLVGRYGILLADTAPVTEGSGNVSGVRVVVSRASASVPNCPNWDRGSTPELEGSTMSNFGCATNSNLAAMIANPSDLVQGAQGNGTDPRTITRAIKSYRDAEPTGKGELKAEKAGSGSGGN